MKSINSRKLFLSRKALFFFTTEANSASIKKAFLNSVKPNSLNQTSTPTPLNWSTRKSNNNVNDSNSSNSFPNINNVYQPPNSNNIKNKNSPQFNNDNNNEKNIIDDDFYVPDEYSNNNKNNNNNLNKSLKDLKEFTPRICVNKIFIFKNIYFLCL
jgi:hypothetical protein